MCWIYSLNVYIDAAEDKALRHTLCIYSYIYCLYINTYLSKHPNSECITVCSKLNILVSLRHSRLVQKPPVCHNTEFLWLEALRVRVCLWPEPVSCEAGEVETEHFVHTLGGDEQLCQGKEWSWALISNHISTNVFLSADVTWQLASLFIRFFVGFFFHKD